jgi:very-short-patch-repair endonuclease
MEIHKYSSNKNELKQFRKILRNNSTSAEAALWDLLKNKQLDGKKFRRQHSLENFIVDFYCSSDKLIIELDGDPHGDYSQILKDEARDKYFEANGYKVIRFENRFVFQDPELVIETIRKNIYLINKTTSP